MSKVLFLPLLFFNILIWSNPFAERTLHAEIISDDFVASKAERINTVASLNAVVTSIKNPLCFTTVGAGEVVINVTGGTAPYSYTLNGGGAITFGSAGVAGVFKTISNIPSGSNTIVVTDTASGTITLASVTISVPSLLKVTHDPDSQLSLIGCNTPGSLGVTASGGTPPYFYSWTGPGGYSTASTEASTVSDINASGNYSVTVTDSNQCSEALNVTMPSSAGTLTLGGNTNNNGQCVSAESTSSSILLSLPSSIVAPYSILWEKFGPKTTASNTTVFDWVAVPGSSGKVNLTGLGFGEYRATVQDSRTSGCSIAVKTFSIEKSTLSIYEQSLILPSCVNPEAKYTFKLNATYAVKYYLNGVLMTPSSVPSSNFSLNSVSGKYTLSKLVEGSYILRIVEQIPTTGTGTTTTDGCDLFDNFKIVNYKPVTYSGQTNVILDVCDNTATFPDPALLSGGVPFEDASGNPSYIYQWNGPNNTVTYGAAPVSLTAGAYTLLVTDAQNCTSAPIAFNFTNNVSAVSVTETIRPLVCDTNNTGGAINISISGGKAPFAIVWEREVAGTVENPTPTYDLIGNNLLAVNNLTAGRYRLRITSSFVSCANPKAITFEKFYTLSPPEPIQLLEGPFLSRLLCLGEPGSLQLKVLDRDSSSFTFYYNGSIVSAAALGNDNYELMIGAPVSIAELGIVNEAGCGISATVITGVGTPEFIYTANSLEQTGLISANDKVTFTNTSLEPYTKMRWDFGDGLDPLEITAENQATTDIEHRYKTAGTFKVSLRFYNAQGCYKETEQEIRIGRGYLVIFPSAFSPNNDGLNDIFEAKFTGLTSFNLEIFDMWGNLLYTKTVDILPVNTVWGWDGTYPSGKPYASKSFRYRFTGITYDNKEINSSGEATLLR